MSQLSYSYLANACIEGRNELSEQRGDTGEAHSEKLSRTKHKDGAHAVLAISCKKDERACCLPVPAAKKELPKKKLH